MTNNTAATSALVYAKVAGCAYLLITGLGLINVFFIQPRLSGRGNGAQTAENILASEVLFRIGVAVELLMFAAVVLASVALYITLKTVNRNLALLALSFRMGEAFLGGVTVLLSLIALLFIKDAGSAAAFDSGQLHALAGLFLKARGAGYDIHMVFMSLGAVPFCYLLFKSKYIPRVLAAWGIFTYATMFIYSFVKILAPNPHPDLWMIMLPGALFELILGLWLLFKGVNTGHAS